MKNDNKAVFWNKPEECTTIPCPIVICPSGATCDFDGIYPPDCKSNQQKIVNGCTGKVTGAGKLIVDCTFKGFVAKIIKGSGPLSDDFMKEHIDWAPPSDGPGCKKKIACK